MALSTLQFLALKSFAGIGNKTVFKVAKHGAESLVVDPDRPIFNRRMDDITDRILKTIHVCTPSYVNSGDQTPF